MRPVQTGDRVQVHYVKRLQNGSVRSSRQPLELTVGIRHSRLPGLGTALVGMTPGQVTTLSVPPERAYGLSNPTRVRRWSRQRFPENAALEPGKVVRFADDSGRSRLIRILEVKGKFVVVDVNHPWAGQALKLKVRLVAICDADAGANGPVSEREGQASPASRRAGAHSGSEAAAGRGGPMPRRGRVVAFDVDAASLASLREALPGWEVVAVDGASAASVARTGDLEAADFLVVGARDNVTETLGLCRLLACGTPHATEARQEVLEALVPREGPRSPGLPGGVPLLVLVRPEQQTLAGAALEAGARSCLVLPLHATEVTSLLAHARAGNQPGRHSRGLDQAEEGNPRQEDGGGA